VSAPSRTLGILGGGQLGRMIAEDSKKLGVRSICLDPTAGCPASQVCAEAITAPFSDLAAARRLLEKCDAITLEWENVPAELVAALEKEKPTHPSSAVLRTIQDRLTQKDFLKARGFPQTGYESAPSRRLGILKRRRHGYDGKGQMRIASPGDWDKAGELLKEPCVLEDVVDFEREISVVLARTPAGEIRPFPVAENVHKNGILHLSWAPAGIPEAVARQARELAGAVAEALGHVGVMAVELFLLKDGGLLVNEIAPRVHNSGHYTLGACATSQFEQHARAVLGLPLGDPAQKSPAVMLNLLGDLWKSGEPDWRKLEARGAAVHLYGKAKAAPGRKMGHATFLGPDLARLKAEAEAAFRELSR
jgi:5-(carboxyamino)imidazole ribonucleotide synthase